MLNRFEEVRQAANALQGDYEQTTKALGAVSALLRAYVARRDT